MIDQNRLLRVARGLLASGLVLLLFSGCASLKTDHGSRTQIQISNKGIGADLELHPSVLKIEPGETVSWNNLTTYHLQIQIEPDPSTANGSSFISPLTTVERKFEEAGTYSYTLLFSTEKAFGRVTGTIVVGEPPSKRPAKEKQGPEPTPDERPSEKEPFII